jgi:hypothetical protein
MDLLTSTGAWIGLSHFRLESGKEVVHGNMNKKQFLMSRVKEGWHAPQKSTIGDPWIS